MTGKFAFGKESGLERLKRQGDAHKRGYEFEVLVGDLFRQAHFRVVSGARAATPRQVDLMATLGDERYLIETKWLKGPANIRHIDALFDRLEAQSPSVIGILISYNGFTSSVIDKVKAKSNRPVLLVTGRELESMDRWDGRLRRLLQSKQDALRHHRQVLLDGPMGNPN